MEQPQDQNNAAGGLSAVDRSVRPLSDVASNELRLELHLRAGPRFQCQSAECRSYEDGPGKWDTCPSCGRKGYLCGSFKLDTESEQYRKWEARTFAKYRHVERPNDTGNGPSGDSREGPR